MATSVKLTFDSVDYTVLCQTVQVGWNNNIVAKPKVNGGSVVEAQTLGFENPTYTLQGVQLTEEAGTLMYSTLISMAKNQYDGSNGITLTVDYGSTSSKLLVGSDGTTTAIPVVVKSFSFPIAVKDGMYDNGSNKFYVPTLNINLQETA